MKLKDLHLNVQNMCVLLRFPAMIKNMNHLYEPRRCRDVQGGYAKTGHLNSFTYLTFDFKTSTIVQQNDVFL